MGYKKSLKLMLSWLVKIVVYAIFGLPVAIYYCFLKCKLSVAMRRLSGKRNVDNTGTARDIDGVEDNLDELDLTLRRAQCDINNVTFGALPEISKLCNGRQKVPLVTNYVLRHVLLNSFFSHGLQAEKNECSKVQWRFSFDDMGRYVCLRSYKWEVSEILILKSGNLSIKDISGRIHTMRCKTWPLAKAHVQAQLTMLAPGLVKSLDSLVLSNVIAREIRENLPESSTLRRLLEPHTICTEAFNVKAATDNTWYENIALPTMDESDRVQVTANLYDKCQKYLVKNHSILPNLSDDIPYQSFLKGYYDIFRAFVSQMAPLLEKDYDILKAGIGKSLPGIAQQSMIDVLSVFLWNCTVVYTCDAETYLKQWGQQYGCMRIRFPLVIPKKDGEQINISTISDGKDADRSKTTDNDSPKLLDVIINIPSRTYSAVDGETFFRGTDICKTKCFLNAFAQRITPTSDDLKLYNITYRFTEEEALKAADEFLTAIKDLSSYLKQRGEAIVQGDKFVRSVCF